MLNFKSKCHGWEQVEGARVPSIWGALKLQVPLPFAVPAALPGAVPSGAEFLRDRI